MLYGLLITNKKDGSMIVFGPKGTRVFPSADAAVAFGKDIFGEDNSHVTYKAIIVGQVIEETSQEHCDECGEVIPKEADSVFGPWHGPACSCYEEKQ